MDDFNLTMLEEDPFSDIYWGVDPWMNRMMDIWDDINMALEIILLLVGIGACTILIISILRFKRLQTRTNWFFFHYAIWTLLNSLLSPILLMIIMSGKLWTVSGMVCYVFQIDGGLLVFSQIFATAPVVHWYLTTYHSGFYTKFAMIHKYSFLGIYLIGTAGLIFSLASCHMEKNHFQHQTAIFCLVLAILITLVINYLIYKHPVETNSKTKYAVTTGTFIILGWSPTLVSHYVFYFTFGESYNIRLIIMLLADLPKLFSVSIPTIVVILLGRLDRHFQRAYDRMFKSNKESYDEEELEQSDDGTEAVHNNVEA